MDVTITGFRVSPENTVIIDFKVDISRSLIASEEIIREAIVESLLANLVLDPQGRGKVIEGTTLLITPADIETLFVMGKWKFKTMYLGNIVECW